MTYTKRSASAKKSRKAIFPAITPCNSFCSAMGSKARRTMADPFGKYDVYSLASSIYCYPDSSVLKNKLDIRDPALLRKVEADLSTARQAEIFRTPVVGRFTATHLCNIHRKLLGDVYSFAGHFRSVNISKGVPSRKRNVLRISFGITTRPRSSILLTIPVAFITFIPPAYHKTSLFPYCVSYG